jgi:hypothetical protein
LRLATDSATYITDVVHGHPPARPRYYHLAALWATISASAIIAALALSWTL